MLVRASACYMPYGQQIDTMGSNECRGAGPAVDTPSARGSFARVCQGLD